MRWLLAVVVVTGCYRPHLEAGAPCPDGVCPSGLVCSPASQTCEVTAVDAAIDVADAAVDAAKPFLYRRRITIENRSATALPAGFTIRVPLAPTLALLLAQGKTRLDLADFRVIGDGSLGDRDRIVDSPAGPAPAAVSFALVLPVAAGATTSDYAIYYGNPDATAAPADGTKVFPLYDDFASGLAPFWVKNDGPAAANGHLVLRANHTDAVSSATDNVPMVSAIELVATVVDPTSDPTVQPGGTFYYWFGYQHAGDFAPTDPWILFIARGKGAVSAEQKSPTGCETGCDDPTPLPQDTAPHYYELQRDPGATRFLRDGAMAFSVTVTNTADYSVMIRNFMATSDLQVDAVRARARVTPDPVVSVGAEEDL